MHPPGISGNIMAVHLHPLPDELLTSWIVRLAQASGLKLQPYCDVTFGRERSIWTRDFDKSVRDDFLDEFSQLTGVSFDRVLGTTLRSYEGILYEHHNPHGNSKWILPLGVYHRTRRHAGLQYCPLCLAEDQIPYFRRKWRLAFYTVCDRHGMLMHERCAQCAAPVAFFRRELGDRHKFEIDSLTLCHVCGADLSRAEARDPSVGDVQPLIQLQSLASFFELGWIFCGSASFQYAHLFMDVLHRICNLLISLRGKSLLDLAACKMGFPPVEAVGNHQGFEYLPLRERHLLMMVGLWLLLDWPERFIHTCHDAHITSSRILADWSAPYWFASVLNELLGCGEYSPTAREASNAAMHLSHKHKEVTARSVGRLLGYRDAKAAECYRKPQCPPMTDEGAAEILATLDSKIQSMLQGSRKRLLLERDRTILLFLHNTKIPRERIRVITINEALRLTAEMGQDSLSNALSYYLFEVRPYFTRGEDNGKLFLATSGRAMCAEAFRLRFNLILAGNK